MVWRSAQSEFAHIVKLTNARFCCSFSNTHRASSAEQEFSLGGGSKSRRQSLTFYLKIDTEAPVKILASLFRAGGDGHFGLISAAPLHRAYPKHKSEPAFQNIPATTQNLAPTLTS